MSLRMSPSRPTELAGKGARVFMQLKMGGAIMWRLTLSEFELLNCIVFLQRDQSHLIGS